MNPRAPLAFLSILALSACEAQEGHAHVESPQKGAWACRQDLARIASSTVAFAATCAS